MIDSRTHTLLDDIVRRESLSLLQYVNDSFPWTAVDGHASLAQVRHMIHEEKQAAAELAQYIIRQQHVVPYVGSYPSDFTNINFVSLEYLLPLLATEERRAIAALDRDLSQITDPGARALVQRMLEMKQRHLQSLEAENTALQACTTH